MRGTIAIHRIQIKVIFESLDDLIAESDFWVVVVSDIRYLTMMATFEMFVDEVNANISGKQLTHLDSLHRIWGSGRLMSALKFLRIY